MIANLPDRMNIWLTGRMHAFGRWSDKSLAHTFAAVSIVVLAIALAVVLPDLLF